MMGDNMAKYPSVQGSICMDVRQPTLTERLRDRKENLQKQLTQVSEAVDALEKNPELQTLLDLVSKVY